MEAKDLRKTESGKVTGGWSSSQEMLWMSFVVCFDTQEIKRTLNERKIKILLNCNLHLTCRLTAIDTATNASDLFVRARQAPLLPTLTIRQHCESTNFFVTYSPLFMLKSFSVSLMGQVVPVSMSRLTFEISYAFVRCEQIMASRGGI